MSQPESSRPPSVYDREAALSHMDGDESILREQASMFLGRSPWLVESLAQAINNKDSPILKHVTHLLEGSLKSFFAERAAQATAVLAEAGKLNDWEKAKEAFAKLKTELMLFQSSLQLSLDIDIDREQ